MLARRIAGLRVMALVLGGAGLLFANAASATQFHWDFLGGIDGSLNTNLGLAAQIRLNSPDADHIGKANLNPSACRSLCQPHLSTAPGDIPGRIQLGLEAEGNYVNQIGLDSPGIGGINNDDGDLNFKQYEITQAPIQITQDLTLRFGDVGFIKDFEFFGRYNAFHDFANYNRKIYYPNYYTPADRARDDACRDSNPATTCVYGPNPQGNSYGFPSVGSALYKPADTKYNELLGQDFDLLEFNISGKLPTSGLFGSDIGDLKFTIGRQTINWGETLLLVVNSLNVINPPNLNALYRPAFLDLSTVFEPIGAIKVEAPLTLNTSFSAFYEYDNAKAEIAPRGGFLSFIDVSLGTTNNLNPGFGQAPDDPDGNLRAEQQLLTAVANVTGQVPIYEDTPKRGGQYGLSFTWFLPDFNNGTELRFYYLNYHSRLPYLSAHAGKESCLQHAPTGDTLADTLTLLGDCSNNDTSHFLGAVGDSLAPGAGGTIAGGLGKLIPALGPDAIGTQPNGQPCPQSAAPGTGPCAEAYRLSSFTGLLEYPEDIKVYGISFNTSNGNLSFQGEIAYRPNLPLQVDDVDVAFAALQPSAPVGCANGKFTKNRSSSCQLGTFQDRYAIGLPAAGGLLSQVGNAGGLVGSVGNLLGVDLSAAQDIVDGLTGALANAGLDLDDIGDAAGQVAGNVLLSDPPGRRNAFPDYLTAYRGGEPGNIAPGQYIQGYERFQVFQYDLGATYIVPPGNWIHASQVILLFEVGAEQVLGLPSKDRLQIDGDGTYYHHSVGNDGTGAPACPSGVQQGTSQKRKGNTRLCGPYQLRFNPTQQNDGFADAVSAGTRLVALIRYQNVLPGISIVPQLILGYDFYNTSPGPGPNFIEGRQMYSANVEIRWQQNWSVIVGATFFQGAGQYNLLGDRDFAQIGVQYRF